MRALESFLKTLASPLIQLFATTPSGTQILTNASVTVNSVDLSAMVESVEIDYGADTKEDTAMGATFHTMKPGMKTVKISLNFFNRYDTGKVNATVYPLIGAAPFPVVIIADAANVTNNTWTGANFVVEGSYKPLSGKVGDLIKAPLVLVPGSGCTFVQS